MARAKFNVIVETDNELTSKQKIHFNEHIKICIGEVERPNYAKRGKIHVFKEVTNEEIMDNLREDHG